MNQKKISVLIFPFLVFAQIAQQDTIFSKGATLISFDNKQPFIWNNCDWAAVGIFNSHHAAIPFFYSKDKNLRAFVELLKFAVLGKLNKDRL